MFNTTRAWNVSASHHCQIKKVSRSAREALKLSAEKSGVKLGELLKDEKDVPCPVAGTYWSFSHKPKCVAAVVSKDKVGIDISGLKACRIISVPDERHIILDHRDRLFQVEQVRCKKPYYFRPQRRQRN